MATKTTKKTKKNNAAWAASSDNASVLGSQLIEMQAKYDAAREQCDLWKHQCDLALKRQATILNEATSLGETRVQLSRAVDACGRYMKECDALRERVDVVEKRLAGYINAEAEVNGALVEVARALGISDSDRQSFAEIVAAARKFSSLASVVAYWQGPGKYTVVAPQIEPIDYPLRGAR